MAHPIPSQFIIGITLNRKVEGASYDFFVKFTVYGEVLTVANAFLQLPENAQILSAGENAEAIRTQLAYYAGQFRFTIPLVVLGVNLDEDAPIIRHQIAKLRTHPRYKKLSPKIHILDTWVKKIRSVGKGDYHPKLYLIEQLLSEDETIRKKGLDQINVENCELIENILLNLLEGQAKQEEKFDIFRVLCMHQRAAVLPLIMERLQNNRYREEHKTTIFGLSYFIDNKIKQVLIDYYYENRYASEAIKWNVLYTLSKYQDKEIEAILLRALTGPSTFLGEQAYRGLHRQGMSKKRIRRFLEKGLNVRQSEDQIVNILSRYESFRWNWYLPDSGALLELLVWANWRKESEKINRLLIPLFRRRKNRYTIRSLMAKLDHKSIHVQAAARKILGGLGFGEEEAREFLIDRGKEWKTDAWGSFFGTIILLIIIGLFMKNC